MSKESLEQTLQPYVEKLLQGIEKGVEFAGENIPEVLRQYVLFEAVEAWLLVVFGIVLIPCCYWLCKKAYKYDPEWRTPVVLFSYISYIVPLLLVVLNISKAIKTTFFSKLFLVETFLKLI